MSTEGSSSKCGSKRGVLNTLTAIKKKKLCEYKNANPNKTHEEFARLFEISKSTVGGILRNKDKWLTVTESDANKKCDCGGEWPQLEEALVICVNLDNKANHTITGAILCEKAVQFAQRLNISNFKSSQENINFFS
nr:9806_t:CDS:1 [Entrophospora candida]